MTDHELPDKDQYEPPFEPSFGDATAEIPPIEIPSQLSSDAADALESEIPEADAVSDTDATFETDIPEAEPQLDTDVLINATDPLDTSNAPSSGFSEDELLGAAATAPFGDTDDIEEPPPEAQEPAATPPPTSPPPGNPPPGGYYGPPPVRRVYRSAHDRKVGGVSGGLAEYFRIDPTLARLATLLFLFSGIGIVIYLMAWLIIPIRPAGLVEPAHLTTAAHERTTTIAFGVAALAIAVGLLTGSWAVLSLALIGGGIWLLSEHTAVARRPVPMPAAAGMAYQAPPMYAEPTPSWPTQPASGAAPNMATPQPPAPPQAAPKRPRRRQTVTWTVLSLLALLAAVGIAAASGDWWDVSATRFLGIGVVIIGVGVVVGQIRNGGARGLIPLGILAALLLFPVSAVDGLLDDGIGETVHRPADFSELASKYEHGIGSMTVDLSRLDFSERSESIDIDLGIGELIVIVSEETGGEAILEAQAGEISHERRNANGFVFQEGVNIETGIVQLEGANGTLDLDLSVGLGTLELRTRGN